MALLGGVLLCCPAPAVAQTNTAGTIRVESKEVLVPVLVLDKQRVAQLLHMKSSAFWHQVNNGDFGFWPRLAIHDLSRSDFSIFQDGEQQRIESFFTLESDVDPPILADNLGQYREFLGIGGGTWAAKLWEGAGRDVAVFPSQLGYEIGYTPSSYSDGVCHRIQITVTRPDSLVLNRSEYCDASDRGANPLQGTVLGKRILSDLHKQKRSQMSLNVAAIPVFADNGATRVRIVLDYASKAVLRGCNSDTNRIGLVGTFWDDHGGEALRFGDLAAQDWDRNFFTGPIWEKLGKRFVHGRCVFKSPFRYETQVAMPPGNYRLQVGLMDGKKFSRAEVFVNIPKYRGGLLSLSGIALARRFRDVKTEPPKSPISAPPRKLQDLPMRRAKSPIALPQNYAPLVSDGVEVTPTANTRFDRNGPFCFFFQIYEPLWPKEPNVNVKAHLRIVDAKTGKVVSQIEPIDAASYAQPGNPLIPISRRLDISALSPGTYELQAKATDSTGASTSWQSVAFAVE